MKYRVVIENDSNIEYMTGWTSDLMVCLMILENMRFVYCDGEKVYMEVKYGA